MWLLANSFNEFTDLAMEISSLQQIAEVPKELKKFLNVTRLDNGSSKDMNDRNEKGNLLMFLG